MSERVKVLIAVLSLCAVAALSVLALTVHKPPVATPLPLVAVIGDSYVGGSAMDSGPEARWPKLISIQRNVRFQLLGVGGSGYLTSSTTGTDDSTFVQRAALVDPTADEVLFVGSRNDVSIDGLYSAAQKAYSAAAAAAPRARVVVIGPVWPDKRPPRAILANRDELKRAADDADVAFIDPIARAWLAEEPAFIGRDGVHPTDAGHQRLAELIAPIVDEGLR